MLTSKGWLALGAAVALLVGGFFVGGPLYVLGSTLVALIVASRLLLVVAPRQVQVQRHIHPARVPAGASSRIDVEVRNDGRRRSRVVTVHDVISGTEGIELVLRPLDPGAVDHAAYQLPTTRRGTIEVGPLTLRWSDPFGLAERSVVAAGRRQVIVLPRIDPVVPVPRGRRDEPRSGADQQQAARADAGDFYALRPYAVGDDLRRVHWASSARHDELLVRQEEQPWHGRTTVVLDSWLATTTPAGFELAVSAAASVAVAASGRGDAVRLLTTAGHDSGTGTGQAHTAAILDHLATVARTPSGGGAGAVDRLTATGGGGALVVVASLADRVELRPLLALGRRFGALVLVRFHPSSWGATGPELDDVEVAGTEVRVDATTPFAAAWDRAVRGRRRAGATTGPAR